MESRQSGRADGRGWGGRGDSGARRGPSDAQAPAGERPSAQEPPPAGERPPEVDSRRGPEESPWVRFDEPPAGPGERPGGHRGPPPLPDLSALLVVLEGVRGMVPNELSSQVNALIRELLLTVRALIDWYLERLDGGPGATEVEEIPID